MLRSIRSWVPLEGGKVTELQLQKNVMRWRNMVIDERPEAWRAAFAHPVFRNYEHKRMEDLELLHHIPNGGSRHKAEAVNITASGILKGMPDLHLPLCLLGSNASSSFGSLYIEMKRPKEKMRKDQLRIAKMLIKAGNRVVLCNGDFPDLEAVKVILDYLTNSVPMTIAERFREAQLTDKVRG